jgi:hypothetical protein
MFRILGLLVIILVASVLMILEIRGAQAKEAFQGSGGGSVSGGRGGGGGGGVIVKKVKVVTKPKDNSYYGKGFPVVYSVEGAPKNGPVVLKRGQTYRFDQSDASNDSHELYVSTDAYGAGTKRFGGSSQKYSGSAGEAGSFLEFRVPKNGGGARLFLSCVNHEYMGVEIKLVA